MATKPREPLAERIKLGLQEALAHAKGELTPKTVAITNKATKPAIFEAKSNMGYQQQSCCD